MNQLRMLVVTWWILLIALFIVKQPIYSFINFDAPASALQSSIHSIPEYLSGEFISPPGPATCSFSKVQVPDFHIAEKFAVICFNLGQETSGINRDHVDTTFSEVLVRLFPFHSFW